MLEQRRGSVIDISSRGSVGRPHPDVPGVWQARNPAFRYQPYDASIRVGPRLEPEQVVSLVLYLAIRTGDGETGHAFDAIQWNARHGFGTV
jgi:hypothetical protein